MAASNSRDAFVYAGGLLLQQGVTFFSAVLVARWLGPSDYGILSLTRNVFAIALILAPLGLDLSLLKHLARFDGINIGRANAQVTRLRLFVGLVNVLVVIIAALLAGPFLEKYIYKYAGFSNYLTLTFLALPVAADCALLTAVFRARGRPMVQSIVALYVQPVVRVGVLAVLLSVGSGLSGAIIAVLIGYACATSILWFIYWRSTKIEPKHILDISDRIGLTGLMKTSFWMALSVLVYSVLRNMDILILGRFQSSTVVGQYAALSAIAQLIQIFPQAFSQTLGPTVARLHLAGNTAGMKLELVRYIRSACLLAGPIAACIAMYGPWFDLVVGDRFQFSTAISATLAAGYFVSAVLAPMGYSLSMTGHHRPEFFVLLLGTCITALMCWLGGTYAGALGIASAILVGFVVINFIRGVLIYRVHGFALFDASLIYPLMISVLVTVSFRLLGDEFFPHTLGPCLAAITGSLVVIFLSFWALLFKQEEKAYFLKKLKGGPHAHKA